jgi:hypothetical protein
MDLRRVGKVGLTWRHCSNRKRKLRYRSAGCFEAAAALSRLPRTSSLIRRGDTWTGRHISSRSTGVSGDPIAGDRGASFGKS